MTSRLAIYHPAAAFGLGANIFGKDVANLDLFQALARHGDFEELALLTPVAATPEIVATGLLGEHQARTRFVVRNLLGMQAAVDAGTLIRGTPAISDLAWLRRRMASDRAYSLVGLIHTIAPPVTRQTIADTALAPLQPWDALIATSPSVKKALERMFAEQADYLSHRMGGGRLPPPNLPLVPLGVDGPRFAAQADRPDARAALRAELGLSDDDILVIWVGRLSFFEKAFPQPMFRAVEEAAQRSGKRIAFALAGWFPDPKAHRALYDAAAKAYAPSVPVHYIDGNDREKLADLWAGADIFLSLVDNIQETFGITPIEAMASGLPVVVSDWDGYRFTVRHGQEGFLIPTLGGPQNGVGRALAAGHVMQFQSYQSYVGAVAAHTAVHVGKAAEAIAALAADPGLRRRMGAAGRERIRTAFDWPVVVGQLQALFDELEAIRLASPDPERKHLVNPVKGDPFRDFAGFATHPLNPTTVLSLRPEASAADLARAQAVGLDQQAANWRGAPEEIARIVELLAARGPTPARDLLMAFPEPRRRAVDLTLAWLAKLGILDWLND
jgi:glycosyltransferase involved in cell wall biosynthesis